MNHRRTALAIMFVTLCSAVATAKPVVESAQATQSADQALTTSASVPQLLRALAQNAYRAQQRRTYREARAAIAAGAVAQYTALLPRLRDYPLLPYLEFAALTRQSTRLTQASLVDFSQRYADSPLSLNLRKLWLADAARTGDWPGYLRVYDDTIPHAALPHAATPDAAMPDTAMRATEFNCWRLEALYRTGSVNASLDAMPALWRTPKALPPACDSMIELWRHDRGISDALIWQRLRSAVAANQTTLGRELVVRWRHPDQLLGERLIAVHDQPSLLTRLNLPDTERGRDVIVEGLRRMARIDVRRASGFWQRYKTSHRFSVEQQQAVELELLRRGADQDQLDAIANVSITAASSMPDAANAPNVINPVANATPRRDADPTNAAATTSNSARAEADLDENSARIDALQAVLRHAIRHRLWPQLIAALAQLPADQQAEPRWRYWGARAGDLSITHSSPAAITPFTRQLQELAKDRSFYGFLAADRLHQLPNLAQRDFAAPSVTIAAMLQRPAVQRVIELMAIGDTETARKEWAFLNTQLDADGKLVAATLAAQAGWYRLSIQTVVDAEAWDVLALRFPLAYPDVLVPQARASGLDPSWVYAIARQESAFATDARSAAGALGLMQLMPATGALTARALGMQLRGPNDLLRADVNVRAGSYYLAQLYRNFGYHRALAAAAYNAGPGRVREWLQRTPASPADVWIESIPFDETRRYVENTLMFSHIYSRMLGTHQPFLFEHER